MWSFSKSTCKLLCFAVCFAVRIIKWNLGPETLARRFYLWQILKSLLMQKIEGQSSFNFWVISFRLAKICQNYYLYRIVFKSRVVQKFWNSLISVAKKYLPRSARVVAKILFFAFDPLMLWTKTKTNLQPGNSLCYLNHLICSEQQSKLYRTMLLKSDIEISQI